MAPITFPLCACGCGKELPTPAASGRPRRFYNDTCRKRAAKKRRRKYVWSTGAELASLPPDPLSQRTRSLALVASYLDGQPAAPAIDQLAQGLIELEQLTWILHVLSVGTDLPAQLAAPTGMLADELRIALQRAFPGRAA